MAGSFFQNNNSILPSLLDYIAVAAKGSTDAAEGEKRYLIDAYCGSGLFAISLADQFDVIEGVDDDIGKSLAYKYLGPEIGDIYIAAIADSVSRVVRLSPTRWRTVDYGPFVERVLNEPAS